MSFEPEPVFDPQAVTPAWIGYVLGREGQCVGCELEAIGTGQVGANYRAHLSWSDDEGPESVVIKFAASDSQSRSTGIQMGTYEREAEFYRMFAPKLEVAVPYAHFVDFVPGTADVVIVMEDLAPRSQGDQIGGCSFDEAALALSQAAKLHSAFWRKKELSELAWVSRRTPEQVEQTIALMDLLQPAFVDRYRNGLTAEALDLSNRFASDASHWFDGLPRPVSLAHGDFRLDNLMFADPDTSILPKLVVVDWQTITHSHGAHDVAYFVGSAFEPELRRVHEEQLVSNYHEELVGADGTPLLSFDEFWDAYRRFTWSGFVMAVLASMIVGQTDRGDEMFVTMANRHASQVVELEAVEFLNES